MSAQGGTLKAPIHVPIRPVIAAIVATVLALGIGFEFGSSSMSRPAPVGPSRRSTGDPRSVTRRAVIGMDPAGPFRRTASGVSTGVTSSSDAAGCEGPAERPALLAVHMVTTREVRAPQARDARRCTRDAPPLALARAGAPP